MLRKICLCFLFISIFAVIMINSCFGLTTSTNPELRLQQSGGFINGETPVHGVNQLNQYVDAKTSNGGGNWTFMVYLDADNNLEPFYIDTFLNMSSVGSTSQVKIVVQMDRRSGYDSRFGDWTECKRFYITKDLIPTAGNAIQNLTEVNMGDPDTLTDFVNWTIHSFPADSYCLVLMNHGSGSVAGVCFDETSGNDALSLPELSQALIAILPEKMDVLYFDACLMGMTEVAYQISDYADIMVASEEVGYAGQPYDYYLTNLIANPSMSASELADVIVSN
jgi:clostripain